MNINKDTVVLYHGDCIDGFTAAWVYHYFGNVDEENLIPVFHGVGGRPADLPDVSGRHVVIVDYCPPRFQLMEMERTAASLVVHDHHASEQALCGDLPYCHFDMEHSGAGLAWKHCCPGQPAPWLVKYVEDRDLWRFQLEQSKKVNAFIGSHIHTLDNWSLMYQNAFQLQSIADRGAGALMHIERYVHEMHDHARRIPFAGYDDVPVINAPYINTSELVGKLAEDALFAVGWFQRGDGKFQFSLRSRGDFDVSKLAQSFGGGGHKKSAGFTIDSIDIVLGARHA